MPATSAALRQLAERRGITTEFWDWDGTRRHVPERTLRAILAALGAKADTDADVQMAIDRLDDESWQDLLPATVVMRHGTWSSVTAHMPAGAEVEVWIELEVDPALGAIGGRWETYQVEDQTPPRVIDGTAIGQATFAIPGELPIGYHTLRARAGRREAASHLIVVPERLNLPESLLQRHSWGVMAQLYSVRSARSWGVGDYADLAELSYHCGEQLHADFVLVNPFHAAEPCPPLTASPYLPTSRLFTNVQYIRPQDIEETGYADAATAATIRRHAARAALANNSADIIDRDASWRLKLKALEAIYRLPRSRARDEDLARFRADGGSELIRFAQWCVLKEHAPVPRPGTIAADVPQVPPLASPQADAVLATDAGRQRVEFHVWLQWIADQQLAHAQRAARASGMRIGIMHDLAVGVHPAGADSWALGDLLARGITAGAPADYFNPLGQDWSQPPLRPDELARTGYGVYRRMLRRVFAHAGAVRIDHIIGLFRLWWIPAGMAGADGAYVRYDHEAMIGILLLEAQRAGAVVIGEDLGLVEPWVRDYLTQRGVLGTSVVWFEHEDDGSFPRAPEHYRELCLATLTTHDLPPTAGFLAGEHLALREKLGLLAGSADEARAEARAEQDAMLTLLRERGLVGERPTERQIVIALHRMLRETPAVLLGISLCDLVGERRIQNQPGTEFEYPNWCIPLADGQGKAVLLDTMQTLPLAPGGD